MSTVRWELYPLVAQTELARAWLQMQANLQLAAKNHRCLWTLPGRLFTVLWKMGDCSPGDYEGTDRSLRTGSCITA